MLQEKKYLERLDYIEEKDEQPMSKEIIKVPEKIDRELVKLMTNMED